MCVTMGKSFQERRKTMGARRVTPQEIVTKMKISKSKDFGFSNVVLKNNNTKEFLLNNRKT